MLYTHRLAVIAYVLHNDHFLLLKRNTEPKVWGPPGGRLEPDEDPNQGILREVKEETGLEIELIVPAGIWHGKYRDAILVSIDYLATAGSRDVRLSDEHSEFRWATIDDLRNKKPALSETGTGFHLGDFERAWTLCQKLK